MRVYPAKNFGPLKGGVATKYIYLNFSSAYIKIYLLGKIQN
jgi:hypothetical protein